MITRWMKQAIDKNDTTLLVRSYTAETDFYKRLNANQADLKDLTNEDARNPGWSCAFARYIASDPALRRNRWLGTTYRGMRITELFAKKDLEADERAAVCTYIIKDNHAALDIKEYSEYADTEEKILILPCMDFEVIKIDTNGEFVEIELLLR